MTGSQTHGVLFVHSAPKALCPHLEWAAADALGAPLQLHWVPQPACPGMYRAEVAWMGPAGTGARIASALRGWEHLRFEVTEDPSVNADGGRWMHTPSLGIFYSQLDSCGNTVVSELRVRRALQAGLTAEQMRDELEMALGAAWDEELEPFRLAQPENPVRWLHQVG
ncbi:hypothetical protein BSR29_06055 [Boudabousia liubingyangii]|uniref:DUF3145 domain-containing protein n=1 Tax=Boudabousia liubingyangii TaxID=1921764 RepID=A0A1Q5PKM2_9ACTO|nr:DUF3145 domain-containing protein [Boudabousia liubingyangii]OKL46495.1 hypothetical protein BSR28_08225 [Boudabousia liubingyangii]OKL47182.1 hypothetical protein BSR29_06055 [Boudabousia liubingyangii]